MKYNTPKLPSNMEHDFGSIKNPPNQRSTFNVKSTWKGTFDCDYIVPCYLKEILPGDSIDLKMSAVMRLATPLHPIMDNLKIKYEAFFVPMRLVWDNYDKFFGEQVDPGDSTSYTIPEINQSLGATFNDTLPDYMGLPVGNTTSAVGFSNLPFRAYHLIRDEWYRSQDLQDSAEIYRSDTGSQVVVKGNWYDLHKRCKQPDYLTTNLPWPQKFDAVELPLGTKAQVNTDAAVSTDINVYHTPTSTYKELTASTALTQVDISTGVEADTLYADLSTATAANINDFRNAVAIQHWNEQAARGGTRYPEIVKNFFQVDSSDSRLQRPELLGIGSTYMNIHTVPQTSETNVTAQGNLAAFGELSFTDKLFTKTFEEHGFVIVNISAVGDITYSQGIEKLWSRRTKFDYYWPQFNGIGEQAVLSKEIYADGTAGDEDVFGYAPRFEEYRYKTSHVTSLFRPKRASNLASWHLSEEFAARPTLGSTFIESNTPMDRAIATPSEPHLICDLFFGEKAARPMPVFSTPGLYRI